MGRIKNLASAVAMTAAMSNAAVAQQAPQYRFDLAPQELKFALRAVTREAGLQLFAGADDLRGLKSPALHTNATVEEALGRLLAGSSLHAEISGTAVFIRGRLRPAAETSGDEQVSLPASNDIVVTGSRIRGAPIATPVITVTQQDALNTGRSSLADVIRDIPQNFGGGQNPGIGLAVPGSSNSSGAATIDLRGIGGDATLTLLNGHRLAYNANLQSIDVSSIPFIAVDRIEVVADGASALYGSDAVAGVANIILKRKDDGITVSARGGLATDGGDRQQQYDASAGTSWSNGSILASYEYSHETPIEASQRSYSQNRSPGLTLLPLLEHHDAIVTLQQDLSPRIHLSLDGLFNRRYDDAFYALDERGDPRALGGRLSSTDTSFAIIPTLTADLAHHWQATLTASYGQDHAKYFTDTYVNGAGIQPLLICYCNASKTIEANANGPLARLPGGPLQIAVGAGLRDTGFRQNTLDVDVHQKTYYAFGEINLPVIGPTQGIPLVERLNISAALRYEDIPAVGDVATPKIGIIYAPSGDVDFKGSWGKSFKAPTLYQRYLATRVGLYTAASLGGIGYPSAATALDVLGGNTDLKPERATTWTVTLSAHPRAVPGLHAEISYYHIDYRDRVVSPITYSSEALSNPGYQQFVDYAPDPAAIAQLIATSTFTNVADVPYDPQNVIAIVYGNYVNAGRQLIHGIDASAGYSFTAASLGKFALSGSASYLRSRQKLSDDQPYTGLAGTLFNPPHFRGRGGVSWSGGSFGLTSFLNYIGGVADVRSTPSIHVRSMTTLDMAGTYSTGARSGPAGNLSIILSIQNLLNQKPTVIAQTYGVFEAPYDTTNYSPIGRFVSLTVTKHL